MPSIIAISETKLNENNITNISIPGYSFITQPSPTKAGGVGMYINNDIQFIRRQDLEIDMEGVESCFIEIEITKQKNVIIGCIYRHPSSKLETFHELLNQKLTSINSSGYEAYIAGDININFLNYSSNNLTSDYLDMLFDQGFMPLITKATRVTYHSRTLIDHIYTNSPEKLINSGICLADISDHLPCFCIFASKLSTQNQQKFYRDFSKFNNDNFLEDLSNLDFMSFINPTDVNESMCNITESLQNLTNKHAPIKKSI